MAVGMQIPPLVRLPALLGAALRITADEGSDEDLKLLLAPGSSLGGARPKASVEQIATADWQLRSFRSTAIWFRRPSGRP